MNEMLKVIRERHSSRVPFDRARPIPKEELMQILAAGRWAPSAHNMQNYQVIVVDDPALLDRLGSISTDISEAFIRENYQQLSFSEDELRRKKVGILGTMFPASWRTAHPNMADIARENGRGSLHDTMQDGPTVLVVTYDPRTRAPASEGDFLGIMSLGCLMENMWLQAESLGIGVQIMSVFSGNRVEPHVKEMLGIPAPLRIAFAARLGFPLRKPNLPRVRRDLADFAHHNHFGKHDLG